MAKADIELKVEGLQELNRKLDQFALKTQKSMVTSALRAGAKIVQAAAKANAHKSKHPSSGALAESVGIKAKRFGRGGKGSVSSLWVGALRSDKKAVAQYAGFYGKASVKSINGGIRHGHLVEFGTKHQEARPWLYPALKGNEQAVVNRFRTVLSKRIEREVKKINKAKK